MLDRRLQPPRVFYYLPDVAACLPGFSTHFRLPFVNNQGSRQWLQGRKIPGHGIDLTSHRTRSRELDSIDDDDGADLPFRNIKEELSRSSLVFGNLECPLSERGRRMSNDCCYSASPRFAAGLKDAGFRVLSLANNHSLDFGETAFRDTLVALGEQGIAVVGAGPSLEQARQPAVFESDTTRIAFLGYNMIGPDWLYAGDSEWGVVPLNPLLVSEDIARIREEVDLVLVSVHWGEELKAFPWPRQIELARYLVECGADAVLGHHPHVAGAIEIYRGRPIFYSLGNFCFGHGHTEWEHNMIARLGIESREIRWIEVTGIDGCYQPAVIGGEASQLFHEKVKQLSEQFGTPFDYRDGRSFIEVSSR